MARTLRPPAKLENKVDQEFELEVMHLISIDDRKNIDKIHYIPTYLRNAFLSYLKFGANLENALDMIEKTRIMTRETVLSADDVIQLMPHFNILQMYLSDSKPRLRNNARLRKQAFYWGMAFGISITIILSFAAFYIFTFYFTCY